VPVAQPFLAVLSVTPPNTFTKTLEKLLTYIAESVMYTATTILFLIPGLFLILAWRAYFHTISTKTLPDWRKRVAIAALLLACVSTAVHFVWNISWLHSGGSPHGMSAAPGFWLKLNRLLLWSFAGAIVLSLFGRGKNRLFLLAWSASMYVVFEAIYVLQFD